MTLQETSGANLPKKSTNKIISIVIPIVLIIAVVVVGYLLFKNLGDLKTANLEIDGHHTTISSLETNLTKSQTETTDLKTKLTASENTVATLKGEVTTLKASAESLNGQITTLQNDKSKLSADLNTANSSLTSAQSSLSSAQTVNSTLTAELKKVKDPRHFNSLTELTDWLQKDDTNTKYTTMGASQKAFILEVRATRDGLLLPVSIWLEGTTLLVGNRAVIGDTVYGVNAGTDFVGQILKTAAIQPSHPEPLP